MEESRLTLCASCKSLVLLAALCMEACEKVASAV